MFKQHKWKIIISSVIILLPMVFGLIMWNELPDTMTTHWGADGTADGFMAKGTAICLIPLILLATNFLMLGVTALDKKQKEQHPKAFGLIFWIMPFISIVTNAIMYGVAFDRDVKIELTLPFVLGIMLIVIGNYMPKFKQNQTLGIRISTTLANEENWNRTHRFGGKVSVVSGFVVLLSVFLPLGAMIAVSTVAIIAMIVLPCIYSIRIYKNDKDNKIEYKKYEISSNMKKVRNISLIIVTLIIIGCFVLMFTGDFEFVIDEDGFDVEATLYDDIRVNFNEIDTIEYREDDVVGVRTYGYGSARLLMGNFKNDEFGAYTRYSYTKCNAGIVIRSGERVLVISDADVESTKVLYDTLIERTAK